MAHLPLWRAFLAVHTAGSLSAAARSLGVSQPTVSAQLQALEQLTGEQLFIRGARGVIPTPQADDLAQRLARPFAELAAALAGTDAEGTAEQPPVRIGGAAEVLGEVVAPALGRLFAHGVRAHMTAGTTAGLLESVRAGLLDIAIVSERPRGRAVFSRPWVDETFVLVAGPEIASRVAAAGPAALPLAPAMLDDVALLAYAQDVPVLRRFWRHVFGTRLEREPALVAPDLRALREAALAGAGATVLPSYLCRDALDAGTLVDICPTDDPPINTLFLVTRQPTASGRPHVERVMDLLRTDVREIIAGEPG
jgi:DNA-binding transcriptional LysR family regulator